MPKNKDFKFCSDCLHMKGEYCQASRYPDLVTGNDKRTCFLERIDGLGRCSSMANNFSLKKPTKRKVKAA